MTFLIESIVLCLIFTFTIPVYGLRDPLSMIDDYPPAIQARVQELGLVLPQQAVRHTRYEGYDAGVSRLRIPYPAVLHRDIHRTAGVSDGRRADGGFCMDHVSEICKAMIAILRDSSNDRMVASGVKFRQMRHT